MEDEWQSLPRVQTEDEGQDKEGSRHKQKESFCWPPFPISNSWDSISAGIWRPPVSLLPSTNAASFEAKKQSTPSSSVDYFLKWKGWFYFCCLFCFRPSQNVPCSRQTIEDFTSTHACRLIHGHSVSL